MMKQIVLGAVAAAALCGTALAADVYQPVQEPVYTPHVEKKKHHGIGSGWYLRGDVGYAFNDLKGASYWLPGGITNDFDSAEVDDSWVIGGGVGYKVNHYLRTDLTVDYMFKSDFNGSTSGFCGGGGGGVACVSEDISDFKALSRICGVDETDVREMAAEIPPETNIRPSSANGTAGSASEATSGASEPMRAAKKPASTSRLWTSWYSGTPPIAMSYRAKVTVRPV